MSEEKRSFRVKLKVPDIESNQYYMIIEILASDENSAIEQIKKHVEKNNPGEPYNIHMADH